MIRRQMRSRIMLFMTVTLVAVLIWLQWREVRRQQLNATLIAAIKRDDIPTALAAVQSHADPNCRDRNEAPLTLWQFLLLRWRQMRGEKSASLSQGSSALALAVEKNNTIVVEALVAAGARDVGEKLLAYPGQSPEDASSTLMMYAANHNNPAIVHALARSGSDINTCDEHGSTALFYSKNVSTVQALLDCGADINAQDLHGATALMETIASPDASAAAEVLLLLSYGANVNIHDVDGNTPLWFAVESDQSPTVVKALLDKGAKVNVQDIAGSTPLMLAALRLNPVLVQLLLQRGAMANLRMKAAKNYSEETFLPSGSTALSLAQHEHAYTEARRGAKLELIRLLKSAGARE